MKRFLTFLIPIVLLAASFASGMYYEKHSRLEHHPFKHRKRDFSEKILSRLTEKLSLTEDQQKQVGVVLQSQMDEVNKMRETQFSEFRERRKQSHEKIRALLTEDQVKVFNEMLEKREQKWKKRGFGVSTQ